jgi:hypothetical protein
MKPAVTVKASKRGHAVGRAPKQLSKSEQKTLEGQFALILTSLLAERGWDWNKAAKEFGVGEPAVRKWMRAESYPTNWERLRAMGKALNTPEFPFPDWRMLLPPG